MIKIHEILKQKYIKLFNYIQFWQKNEDSEDKSEDEESEFGFAEQKVAKKRDDKFYDIYKICQVTKYFLPSKDCNVF